MAPEPRSAYSNALTPVTGVLRRFFLTSGYALDLAVFRVAVFGVLLAYLLAERSEIVAFAEFPQELRIPPAGWQGIVEEIPFSAGSVSACWWLLVAVSVAGLLGVYARTAAWVAVPLAVYVLGVPQFFGKVDHNSQHLIWFLAILGASRCSDALSLSSLWRARTEGGAQPQPSVLYSLPLRAVWLLIGLAYLSAGIPKLGGGGIELQNYLYQRWAELDWEPLVRIDQYPALLWVASAATVAFECLFIVLIFFDRLRPYVAVAGLAFHNMTLLFMRIPFWTLQAAYVAFVPWTRILARVRRRPLAPEKPSPSTWSDLLAPVAVVAAGLVIAQAGFAAAHVTRGWPFAAYPAFTGKPGSTKKTLVVMAVDQNGRESPVDLSPLRQRLSPERLNTLTYNVQGGDDDERRALLTVVRRYAAIPSGTRSLRLYRARMSRDPDDHGQAPEVGKLLLVDPLRVG